MTDKMKINSEVTVGGQPTEAELKDLAKSGFRSIVNLRTDNEDKQPLSPVDEAGVVNDLGITYFHLPVPRGDMRPELVDSFRQRMQSIDTPAFVHCGSGKRAGAFVMIDQAIDEGWSGKETLNRAKEMGFECDAPEIRDFVESYVDSHS